MRLNQYPSVKLAIVLSLAVAIAGCAKTPEVNNALDARTADGSGAATPGSVQDFIKNVGDRIFFESDSSDISERSQDTLSKQVAWLKRYDHGTITIEGHADERGTREYNFALGERRASATKEFMVAKGLSASRIRTTSFGKERPIAVCNDISCWSQNRRAVTNVGVGSQS